MENHSVVQVQAYVIYLLKLRKWSVKTLEITPKEEYLHFPMQAAIEGLIGWGKFISTMSYQLNLVLSTLFIIPAIQHIPFGLTIFYDMIDAHGLLVPRNGLPLNSTQNRKIQVMMSYQPGPAVGSAQNPIQIES